MTLKRNVLQKYKQKNQRICPETNLERMHENNLVEYINLRQENLQEQVTGTQWVLISVDRLIINLNKYAPLRGSSYIELPKEGK